MRAVVVAFLSSGLMLVAAGTSCAPNGDPAAGLKARFPSHASRALGEGAATVFEQSGNVFVSRPGRPLDAVEAAQAAQASLARGKLSLMLPFDGEGEAVFSFPDGFSFRVRELGARGPGRVAANAVAYERDGGTSFWSATENGFEEWLELSVADRAELRWEIRGALLVPDGAGAVVLDGRGRTRVRVAAPEAWTERGEAVSVNVGVSASHLRLVVEGGGRVLVDPSWVAVDQATPALPTPRFLHTATLLASGEVLVAGGNGPITNSVEIFDPVRSTWRATTPMKVARGGHTATRLRDGSVLIVGGKGYIPPYDPKAGAVTQTQLELYDPAGSLVVPFGEQAAANLLEPRQTHTATLLPSTPAAGWTDEVLIVAGMGRTLLGSAELVRVNTTTGAVQPVPAGSIAARQWHSATEELDGNVLVCGGLVGSTSVNTCERFLSNSRSWQSPAPNAMHTGRSIHTATLLEDGSVLVLGGLLTSINSNPTEFAEILPAVAPGGTWMRVDVAPAATPTLGASRLRHTAASAGGRLVLLAGGIVASGVANSLLADVSSSQGVWWLGLNRAEEVAGLGARANLTLTELSAPGAAQKSFLAVGGSDAGNSVPVAAPDVAKLVFVGAPLGPGSDCVSGSQCQSGRCEGSVCCADPAGCGVCQVCTGPSGGCHPRGPQELDPRCVTSGVCDGAGGCLLGRGEPCADAARCASNLCEDGVCCDRQCGASDPTDCQACSVAAGAPTDGTCANLPSTAVCRPAVDAVCDLPERCTGSSPSCPGDEFAPADLCGAQNGCRNDRCVQGRCQTYLVPAPEAPACGRYEECLADTGWTPVLLKDFSKCAHGLCLSGDCLPVEIAVTVTLAGDEQGLARAGGTVPFTVEIKPTWALGQTPRELTLLLGLSPAGLRHVELETRPQAGDRQPVDQRRSVIVRESVELDGTAYVAALEGAAALTAEVYSSDEQQLAEDDDSLDIAKPSILMGGCGCGAGAGASSSALGAAALALAALLGRRPRR